MWVRQYSPSQDSQVVRAWAWQSSSSHSPYSGVGPYGATLGIVAWFGRGRTAAVRLRAALNSGCWLLTRARSGIAVPYRSDRATATKEMIIKSRRRSRMPDAGHAPNVIDGTPRVSVRAVPTLTETTCSA